MNTTIKNPSFNEIDAAFKNLNITSHDKNKNESMNESMKDSFSSKQKFCKLLIAFVKKKFPDTNATYEHLKKKRNTKFDKETIGKIISELINQRILEKRKSAYGDSFRLITDKKRIH